MVSLGIEYYAGLGTFARLDRMRDQTHTIYPTVNLYLAPEWEFNAHGSGPEARPPSVLSS